MNADDFSSDIRTALIAVLTESTAPSGLESDGEPGRVVVEMEGLRVSITVTADRMTVKGRR